MQPSMPAWYALGKGATSYIVVSSDNQVQGFARQARAPKSISSDDFARQLISLPQGSPASQPGDRSLSAEEIADWEALFKQRG